MIAQMQKTVEITSGSEDFNKLKVVDFGTAYDE